MLASLIMVQASYTVFTYNYDIIVINTRTQLRLVLM